MLIRALAYTVTTGSLVSPDVFSGSLVRAAGENIGTTYAITKGTLALSANYNLSFVGANFSITARPITVTANSGQTKVYGNADPVAFAYTVTTGSLVSPDVFSGSLVRAAGTGVGLYAITQGTLALSSNYNLSFVGANFSITARPITVTANSGQTKVYGNADPVAFAYTVTTGSLVSPDVFSGSLVRAAGTGVGLYAITQGTLALSANYTLSFVGANFSITARPITVTATSGLSKVYGAADPTFTYMITSGSPSERTSSRGRSAAPPARPSGPIPSPRAPSP